MFETLRAVSVGAAAVCSSVLFVTLLHRPNRQFVRLSIGLMMAGAWLWLTGQFVSLLLVDVPGVVADWLRWLNQLTMCVGVLLIPCGMLHSIVQVWRVRRERRLTADWRSGLCYLPLLLAPLPMREFAAFEGDFDALTSAWQLPYLLCAGAISVAAACIYLKIGRRLRLPLARPFFGTMGWLLLALTAGQFALYFLAPLFGSNAERCGALLLTLSPIVPVLVFGYFVLRFQFMQLMLERSLVYGACLVTILLLHQLAFQDMSAKIPDLSRMHLTVLEIIALTMLIALYEPLRQRCAEALRHLFGSRATVLRTRLRAMSAELSQQSGRYPGEILRWFVGTLRERMGVSYVSAWVFDGKRDLAFGSNDDATWTKGAARRLHACLCSGDHTFATSRQNADEETAALLQKHSAGLAIVKDRPQFAGLLVLGRGPRQRELGGEEIHAALLLVEQLTATLENSILQAQQMATERRALQNEKLSALGLLASSIAHEVKNPLSAIKTITTVLAEDLGPENRHAEDVRLILGEVDRLATTTSKLLEIARPRAVPRSPASLADAIDGTLRLLRHLACQREIALEATVPHALPPIRADEHSLREIFFNLLSNSLDAAGPRGHVRIECQRVNGFVVTRVHDSGPGIAEEMRTHLFEPFWTTKPSGTGLGLYVVGRRVGELGGTIVCESGPDAGTCFIIQLPCEHHDHEDSDRG